MTKIIYITSDHETYEVDADNGANLMDTALDNGVPGIDGDCGGAAACGTCLVHVDAAFVDIVGGPATELESEMLALTDTATDSSRLGCQITVSDALEGLTLRLPEGQH